MAVVRRPPPLRPPSPQFHVLAAGSSLTRIYNPNAHGATATSFRAFGPLLRFDHHTRKRGKPWLNPTRKIYYAGLTVSCCVVEVFGDDGEINAGDFVVARPVLTRSVRLLDLRCSGAMQAGTLAAICSVPSRSLSQSWAAYFYRTAVYENADGIVYPNAHNGEQAVALFERAESALHSDPSLEMRLDHPLLRTDLRLIAKAHDMIVV